MQIHVVKSGDSIFTISQLYRIPPGILVQTNNILNPGNLVIGQTIVIPITGSYRFVQPGESLYSISKEYSISAAELARINGISNPSIIYPGMRLYIPPKKKKSLK